MCLKIYHFVDYLQDRKAWVPVQEKEKQPPKSILDAQFYKIKADQMMYIYEALSGENGLLTYTTRTKSYLEIWKKKRTEDLTKSAFDITDCEICNEKHHPDS